MSVRHVFADFRFIFVKCSCSRRDGTSLFSLFYKIILYIQGSRCTCVVALVLVHGLPAPKRARCQPQHISRRKISLIRCKRFSRAWFHTARVKAEQRQRRRGAYAEREQRAHCAFTPRVSTSAKVRAAEDLVFKLK